ncbi:ABC transporter substrate-binding protein [Actinomyces wuliandei]|uniref:ABC transporter substrate-binding protein n=1 Tax=Actinomyces wuliandei TaxID=2057743 RepID=UPI000FDB9E61|nr:ABC transporter substrate-binding protein [Actinomyces wuliandei]
MRNTPISRRSLGLGLGAAAVLLASGCSSGSPEGSPTSGAAGSQGTSGGGVLTLAYNADGPHQAWVEAVCDSVSSTLGVTMEPLPLADLSALRDEVDNRTVVGAFRSSWRADYPSAASVLASQYRTGGEANTTDYSSVELDDLLAQAAAADDAAAVLALCEQAQSVLLADLPVIPLWYHDGAGGWSSTVSDVTWSWNGLPVYEAMRTSVEDGVIRARGTEPRHPLVPSTTNEPGGRRVVDLLFSGLVRYREDGTVVNEMAESITTEDNQHFTVTIKDDWAFGDGTAVTSDSFIRAWDYGAQASHNHVASHLYAPIEGFSAEEDSELTGLSKVDDRTFTITLTEPTADFVQRLGCPAFYPLPATAFKDMEAFGESPVGNGPYVLDEWSHHSEVILVPNPLYSGERAVANDGVTFMIYPDDDASYADLLAGELDVVDAVPSTRLSTFEEDLEGRAVTLPGDLVQGLAINVDAPHWGTDTEGRLRRAALSRAINREEICETVYEGACTPASDVTSPVMVGWTAEVPGNEVLTYDEAEARSLWEKAEAVSAF